MCLDQVYVLDDFLGAIFVIFIFFINTFGQGFNESIQLFLNAGQAGFHLAQVCALRAGLEGRAVKTLCATTVHVALIIFLEAVAAVDRLRTIRNERDLAHVTAAVALGVMLRAVLEPTVFAAPIAKPSIATSAIVAIIVVHIGFREG